MTRFPALSEADVRLRLYPSSGRVVRVTDGYWPSRDLFGCRVLVSRDAPPDVLANSELRMSVSETKEIDRA